MQSSPSNSDFQIGKSHIDLFHIGEPIRIDDRDVQGVSTYLAGPENWLEHDQQRRVVDIEFRDADGQIRRAMVQQRVSPNLYDDLADYAHRVSVIAADNTLEELAANNTVERHGFMINDQGVLLTASGETLCCGLFDMQVIDYAGDRTLLWIEDDPEPAAILRMDDPNALTLSQLLPRLIASADDSGETRPRLIGQIRCDPRDVGSSKAMKVVALLIAVVAGVSAAMLTANGLQAPKLPVLLGLIPMGVPIALLLAWQVLRTVPSLAVFRHGVCIRQNKNLHDVNWDQIQSAELTDREVNLGDGEHANYVRIYTLHLRTTGEHDESKRFKLSWQLNDTTYVCTYYLRRRIVQLNETRIPDSSIKVTSDQDDLVPTTV